MNNNTPIRLLVVEDDDDDYFLLESRLKASSLKRQIIWANSFDKSIEILNSTSVDLVIIDYKLGMHTGIEIVSYITEKFPFTPTILLTGLKAAAIDEQALKLGAYDYLAKDEYSIESIDRSIRYALEKSNVLKSLKKSENKFKSLFENSVEYVFIIDSNLTVTDANKSALKLFESESKDKVIGLNVSDFIFPKICEIENHTNSSAEIEFVIPELNKKCFCILNLSVIDIDNGSYQLVLHDITERRLNEQKEKLFEKQALTGKVARIIAHEIKNPLTNIHLSLFEIRALLKDNSVKDIKESPEEFLDIIERNGKRINLLIEDLLNATRFDTINFGEVFIDELISETLFHIQDRIKLKEVKIETDIQENILIKGDKEKLIIALLNILVNAVEAVFEKKGRLKITTSLSNGIVNIIIDDNGKGIPQQDLNKLFEPFFTSKKGGTGLGLTATYNIISKHDGNIKVTSKEGEGSIFVVSLPTLA